MKKAFLWACLWISCQSQAAPQNKINPFFYVVYKQGQIGFILGTYHFLTLAELPTFVTVALKKAPVFVNESGFKKINTKVIAPAESLEPATHQRLLERGLSSDFISHAPASGLCMAYLFLESYQRILQEGGSLDHRLAEMAHSKHKKIEPLDNAALDEVVDENVTQACDIDSLVQKVSPDQARALQDRTLDSFRSGDFRKIPGASSGHLAAVAERNRIWLTKLKQLLSEKAFVAVGAGHLGGSLGLLNLLRLEGYEIRRIQSSDELSPFLGFLP